MRRLVRRMAGAALVVVAMGIVVGKLWLDGGGPYLEALPPYPYCEEARAELRAGRPLDAIELAEAGGCSEALADARREWNALSAVFSRCVKGALSGRGEDAYGVGCAVASDLVVFGDVRDLTLSGVGWLRGEEVDPFIVGLSAAGIALTFAPHAGAGASLLKGARRAGAISARLTKSITDLVRRRAWRPLAGMLGDAGRIGRKLTPAKATRALRYADDADDLATLARFVEVAPSPLLGLRWGGKSAARMTDRALYAAALTRGPKGFALATGRGGKALLARKPLLIFAAKTIYRNEDAAARLAELILRHATWPWVGGVAALLAFIGVLMFGRGARPVTPPYGAGAARRRARPGGTR